MKVVYEWLKEYVGDEMPTTEKLEELLTFHAFEVDGIERVGKDDVLDVKVLPDRSSDCLSHRGIACEISTLTGKVLVVDPLKEKVTLEPLTDKIHVTIHDTTLCRRFTGALITGVQVGESPAWLKSRLEAVGQRSINNVVDATNYVMLGLGQPLHAYDGDLFPHTESGWKFGVRMAKDGEEVVTLSSETYTLKDTVGLIVDDAHDMPIGIAGIKGGKSAEITTNTKTVILEAANFDPVRIRRASQFLKLQTDASKRFENDIVPELASYGLSACVKLILEIAGGTCVGYADVHPVHTEKKIVSVTKTQIESLLGVTLDHDTITQILARIGCTCEIDGDIWKVTPPFERTDILIAEDLIAEVGRVYGYEHVEAVIPEAVHLLEHNARYYYSEKVRTLLTERGCSEVITSSFRKKDQIELQNALASDKGFLRSSLRENIREVLDRNMPNADLLDLEHIHVFEIGTVFSKSEQDDDVVEHVELAIGTRLKQGGYSPKDDTAVLEHITALGTALGVSLSGTLEKGVYTCNLTSVIQSLPIPTSYNAYVKSVDATFAPFSTYPFIARDIALWTSDGTSVESIQNLIEEEAGELLLRIRLFDTFSKEGRTSYAWRLIFQSFERTLTDEEVNQVMERIYARLRTQGFEIR